jgi:hypothetical protein
MPDYTYSPDTVLVEATGELAIGAIGVLRVVAGGEPVDMWDMVDSPISSITVGPTGAHQAFKADVPYGVLDFESVQMPKVSDEAIAAVVTMQAETEALRGRIENLEANGGGGGGGDSRIHRATSLALAPPASVGDLLIVSPDSSA